VCAHKDCWRSGGRELWRELKRQIDEGGLGDIVRLKAVDCLDECKRGPNAEAGGCEFHRCSPRDAENILLQVTGQAGAREREKFQVGARASDASVDD
jgi:NADH:ubiquinone oxidoreductase subunit E